jgi:hypothetical protein
VGRLTLVTLVAIGCVGCSPSGPQYYDPGDNGPIGNGPDGGGNCAALTPTPIAPSVQLLIDRSGTMADGISGANSKWRAVHDALVATGGVVEALQTKVNFGVSAFSSDSPCPRLYSSAARALGNLTSIKDTLESTNPNGTSPTPGAIDAVVADFAAHPAPAGARALIILATDGTPNTCTSNTADTTTQAVASATAAYNAGIRLFALGIGNVDTTVLQRLADAGAGTTGATYYTSNSFTAVQDGFTKIVDAVSCDLALGATIDPARAASATLTMNGSALVYGTDWTAVDATTVQLLGGACTAYHAASAPVFAASFPCS